jgi:hypothetical protein
MRSPTSESDTFRSKTNELSLYKEKWTFGKNGVKSPRIVEMKIL